MDAPGVHQYRGGVHAIGMRTLGLLLSLLAVTASCNSCSSTQKAEEKAALFCLGTEETQLVAAVQARDYGAITNDLIKCAIAAKAAGAAVGSAGSAR